MEVTVVIKRYRHLRIILKRWTLRTKEIDNKVTFEEDSMKHSRQRKIRGKERSIKDYIYNVPEHLCHLLNINDVQNSSGAIINKRSSLGGTTSFAVRGTRSQIQEVLRMINVMTGQQTALMQAALKFWVQWIEKAFSDFESRAYFLPPVFIRRVPVIKKKISGQDVFELHSKHKVKGTSLTSEGASISDVSSPQESDLASDDAFQRVLLCLKKMSEASKQEVFMCLSQFPFGSYLGEPEFSAAAAHLPLPCNLSTQLPWSWRQGQFEVLIIHRQYGLVICQIKAVGYNTDTSQENRDKQVAQKLKQAAEQLDKAEAMLSHLVSDVAVNVRITKTIACPNLKTEDIHNVVSKNKQLQQDLSLCFKTKETADIASLIITSDHLSGLENLTQWWQECVVGPGPDGEIISDPDVYKELLARFCVPASTVTVPSITEPRVSIKTWDQAVSYVGDCYTAHLTLFPEQIELLGKHPPRVVIVGPPGTGKTVVLLLMGAEWLLSGNDVYILCIWECALAAAFMLRQLLQKITQTDHSDAPTPGRVHIVQKIFGDEKKVEEALDELADATGKGPLYVITDEVTHDLLVQYHYFFYFCSKLLKRVHQQDRELYFWTASFRSDLVIKKPEEWESRCFTRPLRSPPSVRKEISEEEEFKYSLVPAYSERGAPDFADDLPVEWVYHRGQQHGFTGAEDCDVCGKQVASFLTHKLGLGTYASKSMETSASASRVNPCLRYRDVLIIFRNQPPEDVGFVKCLTKAKLPVRVMKDSDIEDVATARSDVVWAAGQEYVRGLERKVVVVVDSEYDSSGKRLLIRLHAVSRCSSQLVVVCPLPLYEEGLKTEDQTTIL